MEFCSNTDETKKNLSIKALFENERDGCSHVQCPTLTKTSLFLWLKLELARKKKAKTEETYSTKNTCI